MAALNGERPEGWFARLACYSLLIMLFCAGPLVELRKLSALKDADVWWRLRTGIWIAQTHSVPHHGLFSQADNRPWTASGWLFDFLIAAMHRMIGYSALPLTVMLASCALAVVLFWLAGGDKARNWMVAAGLGAAALWISGLPVCGPLALSKVLYGVELALILHARRKGDVRVLYPLPVLFLLWANLAPEFVFGFLPLFVLIGIQALHPAVLSGREGFSGERSMPALMGVSAGCFVASLLTPYTYHLFSNFFDELYSAASFQYFPSLSALGFRQPHDFCLALFLMSAFFVLGRRRDLFLSVLMLLSLPVAFRIQRDTWLAILPATAVLALLSHRDVSEAGGAVRGGRREFILAAGSAMVLTLIAGLALLSPARVERAIAQQFPVHAAQFARADRPQGPLFNLSAWGGFLTYALPEYPVAIDDRVALYGDAAYIQMRQLAEAQVPLNSVEAFVQAHTLVLPADSALANALTRRPELSAHYNVLYRDEHALVLETK